MCNQYIHREAEQGSMSHRPYNIGLVRNQSQIQPNLMNNINRFNRQASMLDNQLMMAMKQKEVANKVVQDSLNQLNQVNRRVRQQTIRMESMLNNLNREEEEKTKSRVESETYNKAAECTISPLEQIKHK